MVDERTRKVCPKCLTWSPARDDFCTACGVRLVDWNLKCLCGADILPLFRLSMVPFGGKVSLDKHCPDCGARVDGRLRDEIKKLRRQLWLRQSRKSN